MRFSYNIKIICGFYLFFSLSHHSLAQELRIIKKSKTYWEQVQRDSMQMMIELNKFCPGFVYDLRYATKNNFTGRKLYATREYTFLRRQPALALCRVQEELKNSGLGIKVFDAYRPYSVTRKMWKLVGD